jgi:hypothetical protein
MRGALLVTHAVNLVGMCCLVILRVTLVNQPVGKIATIRGPVADTPTVQSSLKSASFQPSPAFLKPPPPLTTVPFKRFATDETVIVPTCGARFQSNRFSNANVLGYCPTHGSDTVVTCLARFVAQCGIQIGSPIVSGPTRVWEQCAHFVTRPARFRVVIIRTANIQCHVLTGSCGQVIHQP